MRPKRGCGLIRKKYIPGMGFGIVTLRETKSSPLKINDRKMKWCLLGPGLFSGPFAVSLRECSFEVSSCLMILRLFVSCAGDGQGFMMEPLSSCLADLSSWVPMDRLALWG